MGQEPSAASGLDGLPRLEESIGFDRCTRGLVLTGIPGLEGHVGVCERMGVCGRPMLGVCGRVNGVCGRTGVPGRTGVGGRNGSVDSCGGRFADRKSPASPASWSDFRRCAIFPLPLFLRACPSPLVPWPASLLAALEECMSETKSQGAIEMNRGSCGEFARRMTSESPIQTIQNQDRLDAYIRASRSSSRCLTDSTRCIYDSKPP